MNQSIKQTNQSINQPINQPINKSINQPIKENNERRNKERNKPVGFYGPIAPPGPNACRTSCPIPTSERAQIPNFWTLSILNLWTCPMSSFWTYLFAVRLFHTLPAANGVVRCATGTPQRMVLAPRMGCRVHTCIIAIGADFKMYLLHQFCSNRV